jgi:putative transposase
MVPGMMRLLLGGVSEVLSPTMIDALLDDAQSSGTPLDGPEGLLNRLRKAVLERALAEEFDVPQG